MLLPSSFSGNVTMLNVAQFVGRSEDFIIFRGLHATGRDFGCLWRMMNPVSQAVGVVISSKFELLKTQDNYSCKNEEKNLKCVKVKM